MAVEKLSHLQFLAGLPETVRPHLPLALQKIESRQPYRWLVQFHYGEPWLHYEVSSAKYHQGWELGFHCESRDKRLNRYLLDGFRRHLFEIKDMLGEQIEAEMWDRGWTKIYEVYPPDALTPAFQAIVGKRLADFIICLHPIYVDLRNEVAQSYR
jgi:hypothetical protein